MKKRPQKQSPYIKDYKNTVSGQNAPGHNPPVKIPRTKSPGQNPPQDKILLGQNPPGQNPPSIFYILLTVIYFISSSK